MTRILVDQDGVLANWGKAFTKTADLYGASAAVPRHDDQRSFDLKANLNVADRHMVDRIMETPGFYADLEPIPGAIEALKEMVADGHDVAIVTSPYWSNPTCVEDKIEWVRRNLGQSWLKRLILTPDKTRVAGDILIDDKPAITGARPPEWEHVYFDQPYNRHGANDEVSPTRRRLFDWADWRSIVDPPRPAAPAGGARVIGMGGLLASGKDTVADHLVAEHGFVKLNMSGVLHEAMLALNPWLPDYQIPVQAGRQHEFTTYKHLVEREGYTKAKENREVRRLLQALGTDVGRNIMGENIWVEIMSRQIAAHLVAGVSVVVSGIRFPNELNMIRDLGGELWWTDRGGVVDETAHASEASVSARDFDRIIPNDGTLETLYARVDKRVKLWSNPLAVGGLVSADTRLIWGGSPASGEIRPRYGLPLSDGNIVTLNRAIQSDFNPAIDIHLNPERRIAA